MPNPWDRPESETPKGGNPWDRPDERVIELDPMNRPKRKYKAHEVLPEAIQNIPSSGQNFLGGIAQALQHPVQSTQMIADIGIGAGLLLAGGKIRTDLSQEAQAQTQRQMELARAVSEVYRGRYGGDSWEEVWENIKHTTATDPFGFGADLLSAVTAPVVAGARGAQIAGKLTGATGMAKRAGDVATIAAIPSQVATAPMWAGTKLVGMGSEAAGNKLLDLIFPTHKVWLEATEGQVDPIRKALQGEEIVVPAAKKTRQVGEIVPGSLPTAGEITANVAGTQWQAIGATAAKTKKGATPHLQRKIDQEAARIAHLDKLGTDRVIRDILAENPAYKPYLDRWVKEGNFEKILEAGITHRKKIAQPLYDKADATKVQIMVPNHDARGIVVGYRYPPEVRKWVRYPSVQTAIKNATKAAQDTPVPLIDKKGRITGKGIDEIKKEIDALITRMSAQDNPAGRNAIEKAMQARNAFIQWAEKEIPEYGEARAIWAAKSPALDALRVGQKIKASLSAPLEGGKSRPGVFATVISDEPGLIKTRLKEQRYPRGFLDLFTTTEQKYLKEVKMDLDRMELTKKFAQASTAPDIRHLAEDLAGTIPSWFHPMITASRMIMRRQKTHIDEKLAAKMAIDYLSPAIADKRLKEALILEIVRQSFGTAVRRAGAPVKAVLTTPITYNLLSPDQQEQRNMLRGPK